MMIHIEIVSEKTFTLEVNPSITIHELKTLIEALEGVEHGQQRLQLGGKILLDFFTLDEADFTNGCKVVLSKKNKADAFGKFFLKPTKLPQAEVKQQESTLPTFNFGHSYMPRWGNEASKKMETFKTFTPVFPVPVCPSQSSLRPKTDFQSIWNSEKPVAMSPSGIFGVPVPSVKPSLFATKSDTKVVSFPFPKSQGLDQASKGLEFLLKNGTVEEKSAPPMELKNDTKEEKVLDCLEEMKKVAGITARISKLSKKFAGKSKSQRKSPVLEWSDEEDTECQSDAEIESPSVVSVVKPRTESPQHASFPELK